MIFRLGLKVNPNVKIVSFLQTYIGDVSLSMGWAWLEVISVGLSLTSLVVTGVWYNREPGPGARLLSAILLTLITAIFRAVMSRIVKFDRIPNIYSVLKK